MMRTLRILFLFLCLSSNGAFAQDDIPDWFFEPDKGEFVGVSMPMTNQPKLRHYMALSTALFSEYISVMENPPKCMISISSVDTTSASGKFLIKNNFSSTFSDTLQIDYHHIITRTYINDRGEEFIAIKRDHSPETASASLIIMIKRWCTSFDVKHYSPRIHDQEESRFQNQNQLNFHWQGNNNDIVTFICDTRQDYISKYDWYVKKQIAVSGESNSSEGYQSLDIETVAVQYINHLANCYESPDSFKQISSRVASKNQKDSLKLDKSDSLNFELFKDYFSEKDVKEAMKKFKESNKKN